MSDTTEAALDDSSGGQGDTEGEGEDGVEALPHQSCLEDEGIISSLPPGSDAYAAAGFDRYAEVLAPNGKPIRLYAQPGVEALAFIRARNLLRFFLTDVADSMYGTDKGAVANAMADNDAVLVMPEGAHEEGNEPNVPAQPLYEHETPVDGSAWYLDNDFEHRDAALEEIFHLVHDTGIGTDFPGALPDYQAALLAEAMAAIDSGRWGIAIDPQVTEWLEELAAENSLAQEYIAAVIDSYYGLWGPWDGEGGMWGLYIARTRDEVHALDPAGAALLEAFLPPQLDYEARLDPSLSGTFSLRFDPAQPYTHKSQYLVQATLTGDMDSNLEGNAFDNTLRGNAGDNQIEGGEGSDWVVYCSPRAEYTVDVQGDEIHIEGPDGHDVLTGIEHAAFADRQLDLSALRRRNR